MRIGVIADIHGNLRALEAVQADLKTYSPDVVVNLGDHVSGPLDADATADLLMTTGWVHIRGNHDRQLLDRPFDEMGASDRAAYEQLTPGNLEWLRRLPASVRLESDVFLCHGSPGDDLRYLLEEVTPHGVSLASVSGIAAWLGDERAGLVLCGHSHIPRVVSLAGGVQIVNPGSVGLQAYDDTAPFPHYMETGSPHARYAILDRDRGGWKVQLIAVEYDWYAAAVVAREAQRPEWAYALENGYALRR